MDVLAHPFEDVMTVSEFELRLTRVEQQISEINVQVARIAQMLDGFTGNQEQMFMMLQRLVNRHEEQLNGILDKPGMTVRMDRLERAEQVRTWHLRAIWTALLAVLAKLFLASLTKP